MIKEDGIEMQFSLLEENNITDKNLKPINLKKYNPEFSNKFQNLLE